MLLLLDTLAGVFLGMCYDLLNAFRHRLKKNVPKMLIDLLFWVICWGVCIWLFLLIGDQKFRFYELFGTGAGFLFYFLVVSEYFVRISEKLADFFLFFLKIPFTILKFFAIIIKNGVLFVLSPLIHLGKLGKRSVFKGIGKFKQHWKLMKRI